MCQVYNTVGSLTTIKDHLYQNNINEFNSLNEVITFQKNYAAYQQQIISDHEYLVEQEKHTLNADILQLNESIKAKKNELEYKLRNEIGRLEQKVNNLLNSTPSNFIQKIRNFLKVRYYKKKIHHNKFNFDSKIAYSMRQLVSVHAQKNARYQFILSRFVDAVNESCLIPLKELERKKRIIDEINTSIYGAMGEQKVVKELERLSDEYVLINDCFLSFSAPIYNRQTNEYINTVQIDHILVSPAGIFLIETKNWSKKSLNNLNLYSPVQQIKRANFALFKILTKSIESYNFPVNQHHWGDRKIPLRNLIVLINSKPSEEFQYAKILQLNELLGFIKYFKPVFSNKETEDIAGYLLNLIRQRIINIGHV
ncbi:nuclease-related domain-containing protein [Niabella drilacis]|uniref:Nuclease-related domain-containing protein n=1 Tax=Niabella drilacis (strain DSM 25811 / CCM 8410 / CCUG 62505 / LMG 26954 / E90) TaxID=1285928 RepID=A0A1G6LFN2_NIADE|nr:nuclease-related domain-containing protein [Niabella drilacis]SDC42014.1 Nuclease-related domain-containing protein [Niabella drilacis]